MGGRNCIPVIALSDLSRLTVTGMMIVLSTTEMQAIPNIFPEEL